MNDTNRSGGGRGADVAPQDAAGAVKLNITRNANEWIHLGVNTFIERNK